MQGVFVAAVTVFVELQARLVIPAILLGRVIPFLALGAGQVNHDPDILLGHANLIPRETVHQGHDR